MVAERNFECDACHKTFGRPNSLTQHRQRYCPNMDYSTTPPTTITTPIDSNVTNESIAAPTPSSSASKSRRRKSSSNRPPIPSRFRCGLCDHRPRTMTDLLEHLRTDHYMSVEMRQFKFRDTKQFDEWRRQVEEKKRMRFLKERNVDLGAVKLEYFHCHRTGFRRFAPARRAVHEGVGGRAPRKIGSVKCHFTCSAFAVKKVNTTTGVVEVKCCLDHYGHDHEIQRLRMSKEIREEIAGYIRRGKTSAWIMQRLKVAPVKNPNSANALRRRLVTRKDILNVSASIKVSVAKKDANNDEEDDEPIVEQQDDEDGEGELVGEEVSEEIDFACLLEPTNNEETNGATAAQHGNPRSAAVVNGHGADRNRTAAADNYAMDDDGPRDSGISGTIQNILTATTRSNRPRTSARTSATSPRRDPGSFRNVSFGSSRHLRHVVRPSPPTNADSARMRSVAFDLADEIVRLVPTLNRSQLGPAVTLLTGIRDTFKQQQQGAFVSESGGESFDRLMDDDDDGWSPRRGTPMARPLGSNSQPRRLCAARTPQRRPPCPTVSNRLPVVELRHPSPDRSNHVPRRPTSTNHIVPRLDANYALPPPPELMEEVRTSGSPRSTQHVSVEPLYDRGHRTVQQETSSNNPNRFVQVVESITPSTVGRAFVIRMTSEQMARIKQKYVKI